MSQKDDGSCSMTDVVKRPRGRPPRLTGEQWAEAMQLDQEGVPRKEIAERFGVHPSTITRKLGVRRKSVWV